jgi:hypothetical protein
MSIILVVVQGDIALSPATRKFGHATIVSCISVSGDSLPNFINVHPASDKKIWIFDGAKTKISSSGLYPNAIR